MTTVTASNFWAGKGMWLNRLAEGEKIIIRSRKHGDLQLSAKPVKEKKCKQTKPERDIHAEFRGALQDWKDYLAGDESKMLSWEEMLHELQD